MAGESFEITVTFPEDYANEELKGKQAVFQVTINSVKIRELPQLDDEFAKDVSEFETLAEYRESLRQKLLDNAAKRAAGIFEENVVKAAVATARVDIPHVVIDREIEQMIEEQRSQMRYQGFELEQYLGYMNQTVDQFKETLHEPAEERVRTQLVLEAIAKAEQIAATDEELTAEIENMAKMYRMSIEDVKSRMPDGDTSMVSETVIRRKTVAWLVEQAFAVAPPPEPEPAEASDAAADTPQDDATDIAGLEAGAIISEDE
jgi:trigger factor